MTNSVLKIKKLSSVATKILQAIQKLKTTLLYKILPEKVKIILASVEELIDAVFDTEITINNDYERFELHTRESILPAKELSAPTEQTGAIQSKQVRRVRRKKKMPALPLQSS